MTIVDAIASRFANAVAPAQETSPKEREALVNWRAYNVKAVGFNAATVTMTASAAGTILLSTWLAPVAVAGWAGRWAVQHAMDQEGSSPAIPFLSWMRTNPDSNSPERRAQLATRFPGIGDNWQPDVKCGRVIVWKNLLPGQIGG